MLSSIMMMQPLWVQPLRLATRTTCVGYDTQIAKWLSDKPAAV